MGGPPMGAAPAGGLPPNGPAPMGAGEIDYRPIFAAWRASGLEHYFVEQNLAMRWPGGALESLRASYAHVRGLLA